MENTDQLVLSCRCKEGTEVKVLGRSAFFQQYPEAPVFLRVAAIIFVSSLLQLVSIKYRMQTVTAGDLCVRVQYDNQKSVFCIDY